jgi:hypothetical protein
MEGLCGALSRLPARFAHLSWDSALSYSGAMQCTSYALHRICIAVQCVAIVGILSHDDVLQLPMDDAIEILAALSTKSSPHCMLRSAAVVAAATAAQCA